MSKLRFSILLIPLLGSAAGAVEFIDRAGLRIADYVLEISLALLGIVFLLIARRLFRPIKRSGYMRPKIVGARFFDDIGELTIEAGHAKDLETLQLPPRWAARSVRSNELYTVEFPAISRAQIETVARENGYSGKVG